MEGAIILFALLVSAIPGTQGTDCEIEENISENFQVSGVNWVFTPQPFGLEGYCRHGPDGRADGRAAAKLAEPISL